MFRQVTIYRYLVMDKTEEMKFLCYHFPITNALSNWYIDMNVYMFSKVCNVMFHRISHINIVNSNNATAFTILYTSRLLCNRIYSNRIKRKNNNKSEAVHRYCSHLII